MLSCAFRKQFLVQYTCDCEYKFTKAVRYMHQWIGTHLAQEMDSCLCGTKPLPEPMLAEIQKYTDKKY